MESQLLALIKGSKQQGPTSLISLPFFGEIRADRYTPLALTIILGLIDGFNPCAMWVLLILLSLLIHLKNRKRILMIAGVFVLVSGVIYFLFMSSLLKFYDFVGVSRSFQIAIGILALFVGIIHVKDFIWFGRGVSLSIPLSMKSKIAQRAANMARLESTWTALISAASLAIFVNFVELLCTAGLPAIYTQILAQNGIIDFERIFYLALYTFFYMLDDSIMVFVAVWSLSQTRLQEKAGRWLKLVSGAVLFTLSVLMIFFPEALSF